MSTEMYLQRWVRDENTEVAKCIEKEFGEQIDQFCADIAVLYDGLDNLIFAKSNDPLPDNTWQSATLLWSSTRSLLSAIQILRRGYFQEPCAIARTSLETACCALFMYKDPDQYVSFKHNRLDTGSAVACVSKISKTVPRTYSLLTEFTHTSQMHGVLQKKAGDPSLDMLGSYHPENWNLFAQSMLILDLTLRDLEQIFEYIFFDYIEACEYWTKSDKSNDLVWKQSKERFIKFMRQHVAVTQANIKKLGSEHEKNLPPKWLLDLLE